MTIANKCIKSDFATCHAFFVPKNSPELNQADAYEVEEYIRVTGNFKSGNKAWAYVCAASELPK